jgi:release factor glutamine methyltransferase
LRDIGTGTGCIAVSLAAQIADARVIATDVIPEAIQLAKANAQRHDVIDRIDFRMGRGCRRYAKIRRRPASGLM